MTMTEQKDAGLPNPSQLRTMANPGRDCMAGRYCERYARDLGGCIAGECRRPAPMPAGVAVPPAPRPEGCRHPLCSCDVGGCYKAAEAVERPVGEPRFVVGDIVRQYATPARVKWDEARVTAVAPMGGLTVRDIKTGATYGWSPNRCELVRRAADGVDLPDGGQQ